MTKCEVKMDGCWHHFLCEFMDRDESMSMDMQKKSEVSIEPSWPNKRGQHRIYYMKNIFFLKDTAESKRAR